MFSLSNSFWSAKELGLIQKLCVELYRLHLHVCGVKVCAPCKCSVVLKKYCIKVWKVFLKVVRNSIVEGVPYSAIGTHPRAITASGMIGCVSGIPAIAKDVA